MELTKRRAMLKGLHGGFDYLLDVVNELVEHDVLSDLDLSIFNAVHELIKEKEVDLAAESQSSAPF